MAQNTELILDSRTKEALYRDISKLAASYTPEWQFDTKDPDIGSTLAMIFAHQMSGNIHRLNQTVGKYHTEFVNLLGISLLPAYPASGVIVADIMRDAVPGVQIPRGSRLLADGGEDNILFETVSDLYVTNARLSDIIAISGTYEKIIPLKGNLTKASILPKQRETELISDEKQSTPISLFDFEDDGVEQHVLMLYHKNIFDTVPGGEILVRMKFKNATPISLLASSDYFTWSYYDGTDLVPFVVSLAGEDCIRLTRTGECQSVSVDDDKGHLLCISSKNALSGGLEIESIEIASNCNMRSPDAVISNSQDVDSRKFLPFGDEANLFDECYIGCDQIFRQKNAWVTLEFGLSTQEKLVLLTPQQEAEDLRIIKRKPLEVQVQTASTSPQMVSIEYYNGIGWKRLQCENDWTQLFDGKHSGQISISFNCPEDWMPIMVGGYDGRSIRLRVMQADNCYMRPCRHTMPVMSNVTLAYTYDKRWGVPQKVNAICGTKWKDLSSEFTAGKVITAFKPLPYSGNAVYFGFDAPMEGAPISILLDIEENVHFKSAPISYEYSTVADWKPLRVVDNTRNMGCAGTLTFMPPSDFAAIEVEGIKRWWIRMVDERHSYDDPNRYHPNIRAIYLNAVEVRNVEHRAEEAFYVNSATSNMSFQLAAQNILSAEVFVSEKEQLPRSEIQRMIDETPEDIRVEYDFLGGIQSLFVRWTEVENFDSSKPEDRHYVLDRMNNRILFGDGARVRIPAAQRGVAFTVQADCCKGEQGNLPAGAVNNLYENILYLNGISNPIATYAGSNIESLSSAHRRGANIIAGRGRLVSEVDYEREVMAFSDSIEGACCVIGMSPEGKKAPHLMTVAVLVHDYNNGAYAFQSIRDRLKQHLLERSEGTINEDCLFLTEPMYVEISLDVWAVADNTQRAFEVQNLIRGSIEDFLRPLPGNGSRGWAIGTIPTEEQIHMMLHSLQGPMRIERFIATARYNDVHGSHEIPLNRMQANSIAIPISGKHRIHLALSE